MAAAAVFSKSGRRVMIVNRVVPRSVRNRTARLIRGARVRGRFFFVFFVFVEERIVGNLDAKRVCARYVKRLVTCATSALNEKLSRLRLFNGNIIFDYLVRSLWERVFEN